RNARRRVPARAAMRRGARWVAALADAAVAAADALAAPAAEARRGAAALAAEQRRRRRARFKKWVLEALEHGAGGAPGAGQRDAGAIGRHWATEVWSTADGSDGWQDFERQSDSGGLPRPTADEWLDAAKSFATRTGICGMGIDRASPRALAQVSAAAAELRGRRHGSRGVGRLASGGAGIARRDAARADGRAATHRAALQHPADLEQAQAGRGSALGGPPPRQRRRRLLGRTRALGPGARVAPDAGRRGGRGAAAPRSALLIDLGRRARRRGWPAPGAWPSALDSMADRFAAPRQPTAARALDAGLLAGRPRAGRAPKAAMLPAARAHSEEFGACSSGELKSDRYVFYDNTTVACYGRAPRAIAMHLVEAGLAAAASDLLARNEVQAALKSSTLSSKPTEAAKNLGADPCLDGSAAAGAARKRRAEVREQLGRAAGARRQSIGAATCPLVGGTPPAMADGCSARARVASELEQWRSAFGSLTFGSARGRSLQVGFARAAAPRRDPWCSLAKQRRAAGMVALGRLGWGSTAMRRWAAGDGAALKLEEIGGHALRRHICDPHQRRLWREAAARDAGLKRAASGAATRGLRRRRLAAKASPEQRARRSSARNAALGGLWPVARRDALDPPLRRSGACPAGRGGRGSARRAALAAERRDASAGDEVLQAFADVAAESDSENPRYSRAFIPHQAAALPPPLAATGEVRWSSGHGYAALAGASILCADGSAMRGKAGSPEVRAGRGPPALQTRGAPRGAWGCVPAHLPQDANTGVILAAARALRWGLPGADGILELRTDCKLLVTGFAAGRVKGRAAARSVRDGYVTWGDYEGNRAEDRFAKKSAELHLAREAAAGRVELADAIAAATARWLGEALQLGSAALAAADGAGAGAAGPTCCGRGRGRGRRGAARCRDGKPGCRRWPCAGHCAAASFANGARWLCNACAAARAERPSAVDRAGSGQR
ncbi:unnamed protein product, partial [Prorocentrum cordatum]